MNFSKRLICAVFAVMTMLSCAFAADTTAKATIWRNDLWVEGNDTYVRNAAGKQTYCLNYGGFIYVPLRAAAEWLGKDFSVSTDGKTITLSGSKTPVYQEQLTIDKTIYGDLSGDARAAKLEEAQTVTVVDGASITLDGKAVSLGDTKIPSNGNSVIRWENELYIPIRTAANMLGMEVKYYQYKMSDNPDDTRYGEMLFLRTPLTDAQLQACKAYFEAVKPAAKTLQDSFTPMSSSINTKADAEAAVSKLLENVRAIKNAKKPDCKLIDSIYADIQSEADTAIAACEQVRAKMKQTDDVDKISYMLREDYTGETYDIADDDDFTGENIVPLLTLCAYPSYEVLSPLYQIVYQELFPEPAA